VPETDKYILCFFVSASLSVKLCQKSEQEVVADFQQFLKDVVK
jgi:hypothetical protein